MFKLGSKQKGLSLIEALLVLGLLATIITVITQNFQEASLKQKVQTVNQEIFQIYTGIQDNFEDDGTAGLTNLVATQLGIKPATVKGVAEVWRHGMEGEYTVSKTGSSAVPSYGFSVSLTNIPAGSACTDLLRESKKTGWTHIAIGTTAVGTPIEINTWTPAYTADKCSATDEDKLLTFSYHPDTP